MSAPKEKNAPNTPADQPDGVDATRTNGNEPVVGHDQQAAPQPDVPAHNPPVREPGSDPADYKNPGHVEDDELKAFDETQKKARETAAQTAQSDQKKREAEAANPVGQDRSDGSLQPAFETNTPPKTKSTDFRSLLEDTLTEEITIVKTSMPATRGNGTEKQQELLHKLLELGIRLSNDDY